MTNANKSISKDHSSPSSVVKRRYYARAGRDVLVGLFFAFMMALAVPAMNLSTAGDLIEVALFIIMALLLASYFMLRSAASKLK
ncbi:MAG: hypothetical protein ACP5H1_07600 [Acidilobus sp.]